MDHHPLHKVTCVRCSGSLRGTAPANLDFLLPKVHGYQQTSPIASVSSGSIEQIHEWGSSGGYIKSRRTGRFSSVESIRTAARAHSSVSFPQGNSPVEMKRCSILCSFTFALLTSVSAWPFWRRDVLDNAVDSPDGVIAHLQHFGEMLYRNPDNETGAVVANWHEGWDRNPEELGNYAEGDILFPPQLEKNGLKAEAARWPGGVVPYMISPYFNTEQKNLIYEAMNDYHKYTCVKFKPYTGEENDYIRLTAGNSGCWSSVGRVGGRQDVNLQVPGCLVKKGTVIHELMHAIGFLHEQSRFERDEYVTIQWYNILNNHVGNFEKASRKTTDAFGVGYDYGSVMHYSANAFSKNGRPTIMPKSVTKVQLGQREGFSKRDIQKIRKMYKCNKRRRSSY